MVKADARELAFVRRRREQHYRALGCTSPRARFTSALGVTTHMKHIHRFTLAAASALLLSTLALAQDGLSPAVQELLEKAKAGDAEAQFRIANVYDSGRGAPRDGKEAMRWYIAAAEQGHAEAQNSVGSGLQADKKYGEARTWYEKAAAQNHALATNNLAYLYDLGLGVKQDRQQAFQLYSQAADLAWAEAMWNLANMYGAGQLGQPPDLLKACVWTLRAGRFAGTEERQLQSQVKRVTPMLERHLSASDMESCRREAQVWSPPREKERSDRPRERSAQ